MEIALQSAPMSSTIHTITLQPGGERFGADESTTLLHAAEHAGLDLPSSCRNGTCRTCLGQLVEGTVRYAIEWPGLTAEEKEEGCVLPCVAYPMSDVVLQGSAI